MKNISINDINYELVEEYKDGFDLNETKEKMTDFFKDYDYILGDWAYDKLRLKGFCEKKNPKFNSVYDQKGIKNYIKENCAYECKYFLLKKIRN